MRYEEDDGAVTGKEMEVRFLRLTSGPGCRRQQGYPRGRLLLHAQRPIACGRPGSKRRGESVPEGEKGRRAWLGCWGSTGQMPLLPRLGCIEGKQAC